MMEALDKYSNRSGYIKKANQVAKGRYKDQLLKSLRNKFRTQKKNANIFVEKTKHAIDSYEEKKSIPYESARLKKLNLLQTVVKRKKAIQLGILTKKVGNKRQIVQKNAFGLSSKRTKASRKVKKWF